MFFHLTADFAVDDRSVLGIFDLDAVSKSAAGRKFLRDAQSAGKLISHCRDIPKSFLVCDDSVYLLQTASASLVGRSAPGEKKESDL